MSIRTIVVNQEEGPVDAKGRHSYFKVDRFEVWEHDSIRLRIEAFAKKSRKIPPMVLELGNPRAMRALVQEISQAAARIEPCTSVEAPGKKPYSVLLKYPESMTDGVLETYYAFVQAEDSQSAVHQARIDAVKFQGDCGETGYALRDFALLLVVEGHHLDYSADAENALCSSEREMVTCRHCDVPTPKAYAGPNRAGDGWIGECCWEAYWEQCEKEEEASQ